MKNLKKIIVKCAYCNKILDKPAEFQDSTGFYSACDDCEKEEINNLAMYKLIHNNPCKFCKEWYKNNE